MKIFKNNKPLMKYSIQKLRYQEAKAFLASNFSHLSAT